MSITQKKGRVKKSRRKSQKRAALFIPTKTEPARQAVEKRLFKGDRGFYAATLGNVWPDCYRSNARRRSG